MKSKQIPFSVGMQFLKYCLENLNIRIVNDITMLIVTLVAYEQCVCSAVYIYYGIISILLLYA